MASSESRVNIEQQILNIVASTVPNEAKKVLIEYCCKHSLEILEKERCHSVLKLAIEWIVRETGETDTMLFESGQLLLKTWAQNKATALVSFFSESNLITLLRANVQPLRILFILNTVFPYLKTSSKDYLRLCEVVSEEITTWSRLNHVHFCGSLVVFLKQNVDCMPREKDEVLRLNIMLVQCLGKAKIPNASKNEIIEFFNDVQHIGLFLHTIWEKDSSQSFIVTSVKECFEILSNPCYQSTVALASLTNYIPDDVIDAMINDVTISTHVTEDNIFCGLSKMMQWLVWPKTTKVSLWLLTFFKCLVKSGKKSILQHLIEGQILQVFSRVFMPVIRESNFVVLVNMLMNSLDSPAVFHKIIPFVPNLMDRLRNEKKEQSKDYLAALGELMYTLLYRFPISSDGTYASLLLALKDIPKPKVEMMNKWLQSGSSDSPSEPPMAAYVFTSEMLNLTSYTSKTGLVNLGNTCYMNCILQCLFMLEVFRNVLFSRSVSLPRHPVIYTLQDVFTFLFMSKRDAIAPEKFIRYSRPPWFPARTQQDCCEFVHYLMDKLEEEDKSWLQDGNEAQSAITNIVEEYFKGILCVTYKCLSCGNESMHEENFTDILLAFPEVMLAQSAKPSSKEFSNDEKNPKSLKGGDQACNFQESRYMEGAYETSKESVSKVQATAKESKKSSTAEKHDLKNRLTFTIQEMLDYFMKPEELSGNNQYFCDLCRVNVDGERRVQVAKLPNFLMLSLKRFSFDIKSQAKPKLLHFVDYPEELTFCSMGESIKLKPKTSSSDDDDVLMKDDADGPAMDTSSYHSYKLCSVVIHSGHTCEAGHYYSYALDTRGKTGDATQTQWYCFNDESTHETSYKDFLEKEKSSATDTTYIVIYMNEELEVGQNSQRCDAPVDIIERVKQDNLRFLQERSRSTMQQSRDSSRNNDEDDSSPPPGNCGSSGSSFALPGNRFIF